VERLEPQILSPQHLPYTTHDPLHLLFAERPNPLSETHSVYGNDLGNVDDARPWQVAIIFVEFHVARVVGALRGRSGKANHHSIYGACVKEVALNDYGRVDITRLRPQRRAEVYPEYIPLSNLYSSLLRRLPSCLAARSSSSFSSESSPWP
jgi:hypothetical protein